MHFSIAASLREFLMFSGLRWRRTNRSSRSLRLQETRTQCECASSLDLESFSTSNPPSGCPRYCATLIGKGSGSISISHRLTRSVSVQMRVPTVQPHLSVSTQKRSHRCLFSSCFVSPWGYKAPTSLGEWGPVALILVAVLREVQSTLPNGV